MQTIQKELADAEVSEIRRKLRNEGIGVAIFGFLFLGASGGGIIGVVLDLCGVDIAFPTLFVIGSICGTVAIIGFHATTHHHRTRLRSDLASGKYEEWTISADRIVEVVPGGSWKAMAVDCGESSIVLIGGWWRYDNRSPVKWTGAGKRGFPSSQFTLKVRPESGRVIGVNVAGRKLKVVDLPKGEGDTGPTPFLTVKHFGYEQCRHHQMPLSEIVDWKTPEVK